MKWIRLLMILSLATPSYAQTAVDGRHTNASEKYDIAAHNPIPCDDETHAGATSWRNAAATWYPVFNAFVNASVTKTVDDPNTLISFEGSLSFNDPDNTGETHRVWTNSYFAYGGRSYWVFSDADILINYDQYQYAL